MSAEPPTKLDYAEPPQRKPRGEGAEVAGCVIAVVLVLGGALALIGFFFYSIFAGRRH